MLQEKLSNFHIKDVRYGLSILEHDFTEAAEEVIDIISDFSATPDQIIMGGGGLSTITKDLRDRFDARGWGKKVVSEEHIIDGESTVTESHEIDHFKEFTGNCIALEIEWNNKPPFFDRDLSRFSNLHRVNKIALGIIITRGPNLNKRLQEIFYDWVDANILNDRELCYEKLLRKRNTVETQVKNDPANESKYIAKALYSSKYGTSTTHWGTLMKKIENNGGYPAPLVLVGIEPGVFV